MYLALKLNPATYTLFLSRQVHHQYTWGAQPNDDVLQMIESGDVLVYKIKPNSDEIWFAFPSMIDTLAEIVTLSQFFNTDGLTCEPIPMPENLVDKLKSTKNKLKRHKIAKEIGRRRRCQATNTQ
jgi:hypothetical protein